MAPAQAEAFVAVQRDMFSEALDTQLATKADILRVENSIGLMAQRFDNKLEKRESSMSIKLGTIVVVAIGAVAATVKLL